MQSAIVLFAVFAATLGNATVFATLGLFGRGVGLSEFSIGAIFASSALLFFLTSSPLGRLSDRMGRKPVMAAGLVATAASLFLFAGLYQASWSAAALVGLVLARVIYGLLAGGIQPAAVAAMADITTVGKRTGGVALVGAAVGVGSVAGPILSATLVGFDLSVPVAVAGVVVALSAAATAFGLRAADPRRVAPVAAAAPVDGLRRYLVLAFAMVLGFAALQPTTAFYVQDRFHLGVATAVRETSLASACFAACSFVVQAFVVRALGLQPRSLLGLGLALCLLGVGGSLAAPTPRALMAAFAVLGVGYGLAQSGLTAAVSFIAGENRQGHVAGRMQAVMSAAWIFGALGGTALYPLSIEAPLLLAAAGLAFALVQIRQ